MIHPPLSRKEAVMENVKYSSPEMIKCKIVMGVRKMGSTVTTSDFRGQASVCSEKW